MSDNDGSPTSNDGSGTSPARRLGVVVPGVGDAFARGVLAGVDSRRGQWETVVVLCPPRDSAPPQLDRWARRCFWFFANSTLLVLLGLALLGAGPLYDIASDGLALRLEDGYAIVAFLLRILNPPLALALLAGVFYGLLRGAETLLGLEGDRIRRVRVWLTRAFIFLLVVGALEALTWFAQRLLPGELPRSLLGMLLMLGSARSHFRLPPRTKMDVVFMAGLALTVEGVASLLWDSGLIWQGWGKWLAIGVALASGVMVVRRWRHHWTGGFGSSARLLGKMVEEARALARAIHAIGPRYLTMPKATHDRPLDSLDLPSQQIDVIVLYDQEAFQRLDQTVPGGRADPAEAWTDADGWLRRRLQVTASGPPRSCLVFCPRDQPHHDSAWLHPKDSLQRLLDSLPARIFPQGLG